MYFPKPSGLRQLSRQLEWELCEKYIEIGADGSILGDGHMVFVLRPESLWGRIEQIDYMHGFTTTAIGLMVDDDRDFYAADVISTTRGAVFRAVRTLQRAYRERRARRRRRNWQAIVADVICIAKCRVEGLGKFVRTSQIAQ